MKGVPLYGAIIAIASVLIAVSTAVIARDERPNAGLPTAPDHPALEAAFEANRAHAAQIGLTELREGERGHSDGRFWHTSVQLGADECAAFIVAPTGCQSLGSVRLSDDGGDTDIQSVSSPGSGAVQLQWCGFGQRRTIRVSAATYRGTGCLPEHRRAGGVRWEVRRGSMPDGGPSALTALGNPTDQSLRAARASLTRAWLDAHPAGDRLLVRADLTGYDQGALVRPGTAATCHAAYAIANRGAAVPIHPRLDWPEDGTACPPGVTSASPLDAVRRRGESAPDRILAVLDLGDLGAPCVEARVSALGGAVETAPVVVDPTADLETPMTRDPAARFAFTHRACPATGVIALAVPGSDHGAYRLELAAADAPPGVAAAPAPAPTDPFPTERPLSAEARQDQRRCERRDGASCQRLALAHRTGEGAPQSHPRAAELFERACELDVADGCAYLAHAYAEGEGVAEDDVEAERRYRAACAQGSALACAYVGDLERATEGASVEAMERARDHYTTACDAGVQSACANRDLLSTLNLL